LTGDIAVNIARTQRAIKHLQRGDLAGFASHLGSLAPLFPRVRFVVSAPNSGAGQGKAVHSWPPDTRRVADKKKTARRMKSDVIEVTR